MLPVASRHWRWLLVVEATKLPDAQARFMLRDADPMTFRAYRLKRAMDRSFYSEDEAVKAAYTVWTSRPALRRRLESAILSGMDSEEVSRYTQTHQEAVQAYHDVFFDVRPFLERSDEGAGWIADELFGGHTFRFGSEKDEDLLLHRLSWLGGPLVYRAFLAFGDSKELEQAFSDRIVETMRGIMKRQMLLLPLLAAQKGEQGLELLRIALEATASTITVQKPAHEAALERLRSGITAFIDKVPLSVADPTRPSNVLSADGSEPRARDLFKEFNDAPTPAHV